MEIKIFDVEHGFCAYVVADNRNVILIDCGHNEKTGFRPSDYLVNTGCSGIEKLIISNYDQDHLSDLANLRQRLPILTLSRNRTINADELHKLKVQTGPLLPGMSAMLEMAAKYIHDVTSPPVFPDIELASFFNSYPEFVDTNNLSLVTFLHYRGVQIVFPGDLERAGWLKLLEWQSFREHLRRVNFFVASHHGRDDGLCEEVFDYCKPEIVIISDESIKYETQKTDYAKYASGIRWDNGQMRYVLTTRNDGMITIEQDTTSNPHIWTAR